MTIRTTVTGAEQAIDAIRRAIEEFSTTNFVTIGIHEDAGQHEGGVTNAQLGAIHEFGTDNIPARPWLAPGVRSGDVEYLTIITDAVAAGESLSVALDRVGVVAASKAQLYMTELSSPANAASTIANKGSSNPLIDTGALRASIAYKVTSTEPTEGI